MSVSVKGFIVSKLFTGKTLHIYTRNKKAGEEPVPEPAQPLWEAPAAAALAAHRLIVGNRAAVFRPLGR